MDLRDGPPMPELKKFELQSDGVRNEDFNFRR